MEADLRRISADLFDATDSAAERLKKYAMDVKGAGTGDDLSNLGVVVSREAEALADVINGLPPVGSLASGTPHVEDAMRLDQWRSVVTTHLADLSSSAKIVVDDPQSESGAQSLMLGLSSSDEVLNNVPVIRPWPPRL
jgi:hypothetical protein